jgi:hypothetical protein
MLSLVLTTPVNRSLHNALSLPPLRRCIQYSGTLQIGIERKKGFGRAERVQRLIM